MLMLVTFMAGCVSVKTNLTGVATNARTMDSMDYEVLGEAEGMHSAFRLFWIFPVTPRADRLEGRRQPHLRADLARAPALGAGDGRHHPRPRQRDPLQMTRPFFI